MTTTTSRTATNRKRIVETVAAWPGVETGPHRFDATEFTIDGREIGHIHGGRVLDVNFPRRMKDRLIADGRVHHHRFAGGGWTTYHVGSPDDVEHAVRLLRLSYLYTLLTMRRKPVGRAILAELDLDAELDGLEPDPEIRAMFDRMRP
ncbi:luciferase family protein [Halalkalicoccus sp. NIPERK01]|uniref:luciferase domain-containing protein n=1 Tax=Halalkalicoccus sp. NIPERK01 TaxID=3053469 RepID=UPI00256EFB72|nr:luciferase family protein [Halalkalicoccus sp. NIPERK01]MDL5361269.1 DUF5519 family protein [Halalkalicoccus sp. NIPERK01]